ncbi:hypothetical protein, partial [Nonomuraea dietziae]|uniref:hypothetical protein n=1 Tax=Nonomuraea dietziae TaxID=65515 RepID=UPI0031CF1B55
DASLVLENVPGRTTSTTCCASSPAGRPRSGTRSAGALTRLLDHYVRAAATATNLLYPSGAHLRPAVPAGEPFAPPRRRAALAGRRARQPRDGGDVRRRARLA